MNLRSYRTLGRSGVVVSPMALGAMTFGRSGWGADRDGSFAIMDAYIEAGGNLIDTAETYSDGASEALVGAYMAERGLRDQIVLSTKFSWNTAKGNPNAGGNGRKNMLRALDGSLKRLKTDYIDVYWMHFWDMTTPCEEVLQSFDDLVRSSKIRYFALSDVPAWYATRMATLAAERGLHAPIAIQLEYSLVERTLEREHIPASAELGLAVLPWSPLGGGFLTGKYQRQDTAEDGFTGEGRLAQDNPLGKSKFTPRNWDILDVVRDIAAARACSPAQIALAWVASQPGVTSTLIGASTVGQVQANIDALAIALTGDECDRLAAASADAPAFPYAAFNPFVRDRLFSENVTPWSRLR